MRESLFEIFYLIWFFYVTVMCIAGFFENPSIVNFLISGFVWMFMLAIPGIIRGK